MAHFDFSVGDGATICFVSDRHAATVVSTTRKTVTIQWDTEEIVSGSRFDGSAKYVFYRNTNAPMETYSLRNNNKWVRTGESKNGTYIVPGRGSYYDPHF